MVPQEICLCTVGLEGLHNVSSVNSHKTQSFGKGVLCGDHRPSLPMSSQRMEGAYQQQHTCSEHTLGPILSLLTLGPAGVALCSRDSPGGSRRGGKGRAGGVERGSCGMELSVFACVLALLSMATTSDVFLSP